MRFIYLQIKILTVLYFLKKRRVQQHRRIVEKYLRHLLI